MVRAGALAVLAIVVALVPLTGCGDGRDDSSTPNGAPLDPMRLTGVYDVVAASGIATTHADTLVAQVWGDAGGEVRLALDLDAATSVGVEGILGADGAVALEGLAFVSGDIGVQVVGSATAATLGQIQRIVGSLRPRSDDSFVRFDLTFTLERPVTGTPPSFGGRYRVDFEPSLSGCGCRSFAVLDLEIPTDGIGRSIEDAQDLDATGALLGTIEPGRCLVSPSGRLLCLLPYDPAVPPAEQRFPGVFGFNIRGRLVVDGARVSGSGRTDVNPFIGMFDGAWTLAPAGEIVEAP